MTSSSDLQCLEVSVPRILLDYYGRAEEGMTLKCVGQQHDGQNVAVSVEKSAQRVSFLFEGAAEALVRAVQNKWQCEMKTITEAYLYRSTPATAAAAAEEEAAAVAGLASTSMATTSMSSYLSSVPDSVGAGLHSTSSAAQRPAQQPVHKLPGVETFSSLHQQSASTVRSLTPGEAAPGYNEDSPSAPYTIQVGLSEGHGLDLDDRLEGTDIVSLALQSAVENVSEDEDEDEDEEEEGNNNREDETGGGFYNVLSNSMPKTPLIDFDTPSGNAELAVKRSSSGDGDNMDHRGMELARSEFAVPDRNQAHASMLPHEIESGSVLDLMFDFQTADEANKPDTSPPVSLMQREGEEDKDGCSESRLSQESLTATPLGDDDANKPQECEENAQNVLDAGSVTCHIHETPSKSPRPEDRTEPGNSDAEAGLSEVQEKAMESVTESGQPVPKEDSIVEPVADCKTFTVEESKGDEQSVSEQVASDSMDATELETNEAEPHTDLDDKSLANKSPDDVQMQTRSRTKRPKSPNLPSRSKRNKKSLMDKPSSDEAEQIETESLAVEEKCYFCERKFLNQARGKQQGKKGSWSPLQRHVQLVHKISMDKWALLKTAVPQTIDQKAAKQDNLGSDTGAIVEGSSSVKPDVGKKSRLLRSGGRRREKLESETSENKAGDSPQSKGGIYVEEVYVDLFKRTLKDTTKKPSKVKMRKKKVLSEKTQKDGDDSDDVKGIPENCADVPSPSGKVVSCMVCSLPMHEHSLWSHVQNLHSIDWQRYRELTTMSSDEKKQGIIEEVRENDERREADAGRKCKRKFLKDKELLVSCPVCPKMYSDLRYVLAHLYEAHKDHDDFSQLLINVDEQCYKVKSHSKRNTMITTTCPLCQCVRHGKAIYQHLKRCHRNDPAYGEVQGNLSQDILQQQRLKYRDRQRREKTQFKETGKLPECRHCNKQFAFSSSKYHHEKFRCSKNPERTRLYHCGCCGFCHHDKQVVDEHKKIHPDAANYICHICGKGYRNRSALIVHKRKVHQLIFNTPVKEYKCAECGRNFNYKDRYERHMLVHSESKDYTCEMCGKQFKCAEDVRRHQKSVHDNRYKFYCEKCGHGMAKEQYLKNHRCGRVRRVQPQEKLLETGHLEVLEVLLGGAKPLDDLPDSPTADAATKEESKREANEGSSGTNPNAEARMVEPVILNEISMTEVLHDGKYVLRTQEGEFVLQTVPASTPACEADLAGPAAAAAAVATTHTPGIVTTSQLMPLQSHLTTNMPQAAPLDHISALHQLQQVPHHAIQVMQPAVSMATHVPSSLTVASSQTSVSASVVTPGAFAGTSVVPAAPQIQGSMQSVVEIPGVMANAGTLGIPVYHAIQQGDPNQIYPLYMNMPATNASSDGQSHPFHSL